MALREDFLSAGQLPTPLRMVLWYSGSVDVAQTGHMWGSFREVGLDRVEEQEDQEDQEGASS